MRSKGDELSSALEGLRNRPIVTESRDYADRWERSKVRLEHLRGVVFGKGGALAVVACVMAYVFGLRPMLLSVPSAGMLRRRASVRRGCWRSTMAPG